MTYDFSGWAALGLAAIALGVGIALAATSENKDGLYPLNTDEKKFYAAPQYMEELTVMDLAKDISDACTLNVTDVEAVLTSLVRKLPQYLNNGFKIQLGNFGRVKLSFSSKGFET